MPGRSGLSIRASTRSPWAASSCACVSASPESRRSGAPRITLPTPSKTASDHLRWLEKGTVSRQRKAARGGQAAVSAAAVEPSAPMPHRKEASRSRTRSSETPGAGISCSSAMWPLVRVPVLSTQITSTRASDSMPYSSFPSVFFRPSVTTPAASETEVSSISPSGIMPMTDATVLTTASE